MKSLIIILTTAFLFGSLSAQEAHTPHEKIKARHEAHMNRHSGKQTADSTGKKHSDEIRTLIGNRKMAHGGYFALTTHYGRVRGEDAFSIGARGGYLMNHIFLLGFGGSGFVNDIRFDNIISGEKIYLQCGYAGLLLEPVIAPRFPVHLTFPVLIGGGAIAYNREGYFNDFGEDNAYEDWEVVDSDVFFVVEPAINLEFNVAKFFHIGLEGKYRYVSGLQMMNTSSNMLNGWSAELNLKFGKF